MLTVDVVSVAPLGMTVFAYWPVFLSVQAVAPSQSRRYAFPLSLSNALQILLINNAHADLIRVLTRVLNEDPAASILTVQVPIQESHLERQVRGDMAEALAVKAEGLCVPTFFEFGEDRLNV